jgi:hypothetical protein
MTTGRTTLKHSRFYCAGFDLSGYTRSFGPCDWTFEEHDTTCPLGDEVKGYLPGHPSISVGALNGVLDNTVTSGLHAILSTAGQSRVVMAPFGIRAAPAAGDPVFCGRFDQLAYTAAGDGVMAVNIPFGMWDVANLVDYPSPWGTLLHAKGAETAANTGTGIDNPTAGETLFGGYMVYQIFAYGGTGSATISIDDSANNVDFLALSGATSGAIAHTSMPTAGIVALGTNATVRRYLRWQLSLATLTSVTFALAFVRQYYAQ